MEIKLSEVVAEMKLEIADMHYVISHQKVELNKYKACVKDYEEQIGRMNEQIKELENREE